MFRAQIIYIQEGRSVVGRSKTPR